MAGYLDNYISNYAAIAAPLYQLTRKDAKFKWQKEEEKAFRKIQDSISNDKTMAFFDPSRPIILHTEASYNQGLSAALPQKTDRGIQPVHFINRTMTELGKRYSQTKKSEKDDTIDERDAMYKQKMKENREGRNTGQGRLLLVDYVLVKQEKRNKWSMPYEPEFYTVDKINGSRITAR